jgi:hypothetical protein
MIDYLKECSDSGKSQKMVGKAAHGTTSCCIQFHWQIGIPDLGFHPNLPFPLQ